MRPILPRHLWLLELGLPLVLAGTRSDSLDQRSSSEFVPALQRERCVSFGRAEPPPPELPSDRVLRFWVTTRGFTSGAP